MSKPSEPQPAPVDLNAPHDLSAAELAAKRARVQEKIERAVEHLAATDLAAAASVLRVGVIEVTEDPKFQTAALVKERDSVFGRFRIVCNTFFCDRPQEQVAAILLHELLHHVMRHLEIDQPGPNEELCNVVQDAFINYTIYLMNTDLAEFFADYYDASRMPEAFLRSRSKPEDDADRDMYRLHYRLTRNNDGSGHGMSQLTETDLYEYLDQAGYAPQAPEVKLIGSHGEGGSDDKQGSGNGGESAIPADQVADVLGEVIGQLNGSQDGGDLAGRLNDLMQNFVEVRAQGQTSQLSQVFRRALVDEMRAKVVETVLGDIRDIPSRSVIMPDRVSRSDMMRITMGAPVFFWDTMEYNRKHGSVCVYVDVSGSMGKWVEFIYGCCVAFEEFLDCGVFLFSNKIEEITTAQLRQGFVSSTMGTDFDCVVSHLLDGTSEKAILFTDGHAGLSTELAGRLSQAGRQVFGVLTPQGSDRALSGFCQDVFRLPDPERRR